MESDKIRYSDLIEEDSSIKDLLDQLENLNGSLIATKRNFKATAKAIADAQAEMAADTGEAREELGLFAEAAYNLRMASRTAEAAIKGISGDLNSLTVALAGNAKASKAQKQVASELISSYGALKSQLDVLKNSYQSMSDQEKMEGSGKEIITKIIEVTNSIRALDRIVKPTVSSIVSMTHAQNQLALSESAIGKEYAEVLLLLRKQNDENMRAAQESAVLAGSYEALALELRKSEAAYRTLSAAEREGVQGQAALMYIQETKAKMQDIEATQKLALVQAEIQRLEREGLSKLEQATAVRDKKLRALRDEAAKLEKLEQVNAELQRLEREGLSELERAQILRDQKANALKQEAEAAEKLAQVNAEINRLEREGLSELEKATIERNRKVAALRSEEAETYKLEKAQKELKMALVNLSRQGGSLGDPDEAFAKIAERARMSGDELKYYGQALRAVYKESKLLAIANTAAEGSLERLNAEYELAIIKLNRMSAAERSGTQAGKQLEQQTVELKRQILLLQGKVGANAEELGRYTKVWSGLGYSVQQVVREMPAAAINMNTFFLAISNNIPIVIDEIKRARVENEALIAQGRPAKSVAKQITSALFSWHSILIVLLTTLSMHGEEILNWVKNIGKAADGTVTATDKLKALNKALEGNTNNYGENMTNLRKLQDEFAKATGKEKQQMVRDYKTTFDEWGISVKNVSDLERVLIDEADAVADSFKLKAKAAAYAAIAAEKYEKALRKQTDFEKKSQEVDEGEWGLLDWLQVFNPSKSRIEASTYVEKDISFFDLFKFGTIASNQAKITRDVLKKEAEALMTEAENYADEADKFEAEWRELLKKYDISLAHKDPKKSRKGREPRDLTDTIFKNQIRIRREYEQSVTKLQRDEFAKREMAAAQATEDAVAKLHEQYRMNEKYVANVEGKYRELTEYQREQIKQQNIWIKNAIANNWEQLDYELSQIDRDRQVKSIQIMRETLGYNIDDITKSLNEELNIKIAGLKQEEELVKASNERLRAEGYTHTRTDQEITEEYLKLRQNLINEYLSKELALRIADNDLALKLAKKGSQAELDLLIEQNNLALKEALAANAKKNKAQQLDPDKIRATYHKNENILRSNFKLTVFKEAQDENTEIAKIKISNKEALDAFLTLQEMAYIDKQLELYEQGELYLSEHEEKMLKIRKDALKKQLAASGYSASDFTDTGVTAKGKGKEVLGAVAENGIAGGIAALMPRWDEKQEKDFIDGWNIIRDNVLNSINDILEAEIELAEKEKELADERVNRAWEIYKAEVEARANGYANNVATAKKELQQAKKQQQQKQRILEEAQRKQETVDSLTQASSLITATAQIWKAFTALGPIGPALAAAATAAMWTAFIAAKVKARQVSRSAAEQEYGVGGLEFLEGGSHASGNDINLGTTNHNGKTMKAEGGEALAIINRRNTRKYRKALPGIIQSLNDGTFENAYGSLADGLSHDVLEQQLMRSFQKGDMIQAQLNAVPSPINLSRLEEDVAMIKKQNELSIYSLDSTTVIRKGHSIKYIH